MSALPVSSITATHPTPATLGTVWQVDHQVRTAEEGDIDRFSNARQSSDDWVLLGGARRVNLRHVQTVWLTFGTIVNPEYRATLTGFDGRVLHLSGEPVVVLQDELLKRVPHRS